MRPGVGSDGDWGMVAKEAVGEGRVEMLGVLV